MPFEMIFLVFLTCRFSPVQILALVGVISVISLTIIPVFLITSSTPVPATSTAVVDPTPVEELAHGFNYYASNVALTVHQIQADLSARLAYVNRANAVALVKLAAAKLPDRNTFHTTLNSVRETENIPLKLFWAAGVLLFAGYFLAAAKSLQSTNNNPPAHYMNNVEEVLAQLSTVTQVGEESRSAALPDVHQPTVVPFETTQTGADTAVTGDETPALKQAEQAGEVSPVISAGADGQAERGTPRVLNLATPRLQEDRPQLTDETPAVVSSATAIPELGERASLKTPSAKAPSHLKGPRAVDSDSSPMSYPLAKGSKTQSRIPKSPAALVGNVTDATVKAVFAEESPNTRYGLQDLEQDVKATTAVVAKVRSEIKGEGQGTRRSLSRLFQ